MQGVGGVGYAGARENGRPEPRLVNAAREFEAQMMKELMKPITRSEESDDGAGSADALTDLAGEMLGQSLSRAGGFGMATRIVASLSHNETSCPAASAIETVKKLEPAGLK